MKCPCINNKAFDLAVSAHGPTRMVVEDQSVWTDEVGFTSALYIDVRVRSLTHRGIANTIPLAVNRRNVWTAKELWNGKEGECIEDGVYCFEIGPEGPGACGDVMAINRAFLPSAWCAWDSLRANAKSENDERTASMVKMLIDAIEGQSVIGRIEEAKSTFAVLKDLLKKLNCDCCK